MAAETEVNVLIIGAGPTGLGAAIRMHQHKRSDWLLIDGFSEPGGLARTESTPEGFMFDMGGHVIYSHYEYFDQLLDRAMGSGPDVWSTIERVSYIWIKDRYVPYPFQNNLSVLDVEDQISCLNGLIDASMQSGQPTAKKPTTFDEWMVTVMGEGIANLFMRPYNFKVWAIPPVNMQCEWLGERAATIDVKGTVRSVLRGRRAPAPKAFFRFPQKGGTGAMWSSVAKLLPAERVKYSSKVVALDVDKKVAVLANGTTIRYNFCVSTIPLDYTLRMLGEDRLAAKLFFSSSHIVGLGLRGVLPHGKKCWLYYPENNCPFYRCTCFSLYAKANCPDESALLPTLRVAGQPEIPPSAPKPGPYWSLMFEISESPLRPVNPATVVEDTLQGALNVGLIRPEDEIVSVYHRRLPHGYPTPTTIRDSVLKDVLPRLKAKSFYSRGRFGGYKYEVANQDHSLMQGVEAVDNILFGAAELTFEFPWLVAKQRNTDLFFSLPDDPEGGAAAAAGPSKLPEEMAAMAVAEPSTVTAAGMETIGATELSGRGVDSAI